MEFHHVAVAVKDIRKATIAYASLGYTGGPVVEDPVQKVLVSFLSREGAPTVELVQPTSEDDSPVGNILAKMGPAPYHMCYVADDLEACSRELRRAGYLMISKPVRAAAFGKRICFLYSPDAGLVELLER